MNHLHSVTIAGKRHWFTDLYGPYFLEGEGDGGDGTSGDGGEGSEETKEKTFSQSQMTRVATREKEEGRKAGRNQLLQELGIDDVSELKELLDKKREAEDADKSEATREREKAQRERAEADREKAEAKRERFEARVEREFLRQKGKVDRSEKAVRLVDVDDVDADKDTIKTAVEEFRKEYPEFFEEQESTEGEGEGEGERKPPPPPSGLPPSRPTPPPQKRPAGKSAADVAKETLRQRHPRHFEQKEQAK